MKGGRGRGRGRQNERKTAGVGGQEGRGEGRHWQGDLSLSLSLSLSLPTHAHTHTHTHTHTLGPQNIDHGRQHGLEEQDWALTNALQQLAQRQHLLEQTVAGRAAAPHLRLLILINKKTISQLPESVGCTHAVTWATHSHQCRSCRNWCSGVASRARTHSV